MQKNSLAFLTNSYPDFDTSSRAVFVKKLAQLLQKEGYAISIVTPKIYKRSPCFEIQEGLKVYRFPFFAKNKLLIEYQKIPYVRMILYLITGCCFFTYVLLKNGCSLIHVHWAIPTGLIGVIIGGLLRKPVLVTIHGSDFRMGTERSTFLRKLFFFVCKKAKHLSCVSEVMRREIEHNGIQREKISTFPMGIDEAFSEIGRNREKKARSQKCTILSNRNLLSIYNVSLLIRAIPFILSQEPDTRFVIAGDGPEREKLEQEAGNLRISSSVQFLGNIPHDKMANLLGQADIYVSTSLSDGTSVSLLEAMGSGAFPVVTDIPANREWIISGQNGYLVPVDEEKVLANRIIDAIRNQALLRKSRIENLSIVEKKALWPVSIWKIKEIYSQVLK